ncbi:uncharacterized protein LOC118204910 [Stegodyphus dumicola]|uniref:uncharacterized protein LOC118204910 n=1 Tax=Stegodyphus dumicola TaxID=202533 RepID=UPI0015A8DF4F|nr:uncharacterized protein LOC118204910 [Stegodyphus dumicola]
MVYGENIKLLGEFFEEKISHTPPGTFIHKLQKHMELIRPKEIQQKGIPKLFVHKDLESTSHVFLRINRVRKQLEPPYEGPYLVINRSPKYFTLRIKNKEVNVSIDRLKPAYIIPQQTPEQEKPTTSNCVNNASTPIEIQTTLTVAQPKIKSALRQSRTGRILKTPLRFKN